LEAWHQGTPSRSPRPSATSRSAWAARSSPNRTALRLDETGHSARYYIPREDVRTDLLHPTAQHTTCPYKGQASYWSAQVDGEAYENLVWSYETPIPGAEQIKGLMCFYNERAHLTVSEQHEASAAR